MLFSCSIVYSLLSCSIHCSLKLSFVSSSLCFCLHIYIDILTISTCFKKDTLHISFFPPYILSVELVAELLRHWTKADGVYCLIPAKLTMCKFLVKDLSLHLLCPPIVVLLGTRWNESLYSENVLSCTRCTVFSSGR